MYIPTAREKRHLGTNGVKHGRHHVAYKVLFRRVVGPSRPASVALSVVFFLHLYCHCYICFVTRKPFKPRRVCGISLVSGDTLPVFVSHRVFFSLFFSTWQCHRLSGISVFSAFMPATGARPKTAKINLMDCSCLCSEAEILLDST